MTMRWSSVDIRRWSCNLTDMLNRSISIAHLGQHYIYVATISRPYSGLGQTLYSQPASVHMTQPQIIYLFARYCTVSRPSMICMY